MTKGIESKRWGPEDGSPGGGCGWQRPHKPSGLGDEAPLTQNVFLNLYPKFIFLLESSETYAKKSLNRSNNFSYAPISMKFYFAYVSDESKKKIYRYI